MEMLEEVQEEVNGEKRGNGYGFDLKSNPDYLIENRVFDAYVPEGQSLDNIKKLIRRKTLKQTDNIIIATENYTEDVGELKNFLLGQKKMILNI